MIWLIYIYMILCDDLKIISLLSFTCIYFYNEICNVTNIYFKVR